MSSGRRSWRKELIGAVSDGSETPSRVEIFDVLSNQRRQYTMHYLKENAESGSFEFDDLVDYVTACESDTGGEISSVERKRVYNALRQMHLPKLDDTGIIEYDPETNRIELAEAAHIALLYLERPPRTDIPWHACYLGLSVATIGLVSANWAGVPLLSRVSGSTIVAVALVAFVILAVGHTIDARSKGLEADGWFSVSSAEKR